MQGICVCLHRKRLNINTALLTNQRYSYMFVCVWLCVDSHIKINKKISTLTCALSSSFANAMTSAGSCRFLHVSYLFMFVCGDADGYAVLYFSFYFYFILLFHLQMYVLLHSGI